MSAMSLCEIQTAPLLTRADAQTECSEPFEAGWAREALLIAYLDGAATESVELGLQLSADGLRWIDTNQTLNVNASSGAYLTLSSFGNWLRLRTKWPLHQTHSRLDAYLVLKS